MLAAEYDVGLWANIRSARLRPPKGINDGMLRTPTFEAVMAFAPTSSSAITTRPSYSTASASTSGFSILQGAHQVAQKSSKTSCVEAPTVVSKFWSVTWTMFFVVMRLLLQCLFSLQF